MFQLYSISYYIDECYEALEAIQEMENEGWERYSSILEDKESTVKNLNIVNLITSEGDSKSCIPNSKYQSTFYELVDRVFSILFLLSLATLLKIFAKSTNFQKI